ncbi:helix-turn-helix domain-containing protein [Micromonospora sp. NPDC047812]|uniref:TetR/AcrR family transcriptional regulator n=1 Tax=Micromonospora sp. NPDC047812 TaxID=3155742 RepID=UPI00345575E5
MEPLTRRAGRPRSFDPDVALDTALAQFWEHGYEGASLARLQEATGLTAPALYRAFGSKEQLFEQAVKRYQDKQGFALNDELPFRRAVAEYLTRAAREFTTGPGRGCMISTGMLATSPDAHVAAEAVRIERERALDMIRNRCDDALEQGELPEGTDTESLARALAAVIQGMSVQARDGADTRQLEGLAEAAMAVIPSRG